MPGLALASGARAPGFLSLGQLYAEPVMPLAIRVLPATLYIQPVYPTFGLLTATGSGVRLLPIQQAPPRGRMKHTPFGPFFIAKFHHLRITERSRPCPNRRRRVRG